MAAHEHRDVRRARPAVDRRARVVLGRGRALPRPAVHRAVHRGARHVGGDRRRRSGSPAAAPTSRSAASTGGPTTRSAPREPAVVWEGEEGDVRTLTYVGAAHAHRSHRVRLGAPAASAPATRSACSCRWCPRRSPRCSRSRSSARSSCRSSPGYGADAVAIRLEDGGAVALVTADGFTRRGRGRSDEGDRRRRGRAGPVGAHGRRRAAARPHRRADAGRVATSRSTS